MSEMSYWETHGLLILGAVTGPVGIRFASHLMNDYIIGIIGLLLILFTGVLWISAGINWERPKKKL
jgi:uncharacterized membrane protein YfcA